MWTTNETDVFSERLRESEGRLWNKGLIRKKETILYDV